MTTDQPASTREWHVEETVGRTERPQAVLIGPGQRFILYTTADAEELATILNAQTAALVEAADNARRYDCGKSNLQKAAMVPCRNLPRDVECYACQIARARFERNSMCICDDDDELPTGPADYCPVHGNTYKYVLREEARLVDIVHARAAAVERADAAEARVEQLETALRRIAAMSGESAHACAEAAREALDRAS
jgi:hypothetical protein